MVIQALLAYFYDKETSKCNIIITYNIVTSTTLQPTNITNRNAYEESDDVLYCSNCLSMFL